MHQQFLAHPVLLRHKLYKMTSCHQSLTPAALDSSRCCCCCWWWWCWCRWVNWRRRFWTRNNSQMNWLRCSLAKSNSSRRASSSTSDSECSRIRRSISSTSSTNTPVDSVRNTATNKHQCRLWQTDRQTDRQNHTARTGLSWQPLGYRPTGWPQKPRQLRLTAHILKTPELICMIFGTFQCHFAPNTSFC